MIALAVLLAILGAIGASALKPDGEADTLVDKGSETYAATEDFKTRVGQSGATLFSLGPDELDKFTAAELTRWTGIIRKLGITAQ